MNITLAGKKVLVIGGSRGIGAQIVRDCAAAGADVAWSYFSANGLKASEALKEEVAAFNVKTLMFQADCTSEADTLALYEKIQAQWGGIDALVYNAGFTSPKNFCDISYEEWKKTVDINLNGAFLAIREAIPMMQRAGKGSIVIIGSAAVKNPEFVREAVAKYGDRIAVGIDALGGTVRTEGWLKDSGEDYIGFAKLMESYGVRTIIFTNIDKDGMLEGPNFEQLGRLRKAVSCGIVASGGVSTLEDIRRLRELGIEEAIAGKAVYTGALDLAAAIGEAK